ncbi:helix-turn-helix transcriptional regulator [Massilia luteola]|uniref:helix-turn-helix domain-containing protein n=1 Tax=Massilia luteola TaxID=3081751 RepID=UPI002ACC1926|nr:helix-turn-helix transcriptional regulator [Massilia sp. Gc5]
MRTDYEIELCKLFGKNLVRVRRDRLWSQERLALESGLARSYVGDVERGLRNISLVNICRFADALGVDVSELTAFRQVSDLQGANSEHSDKET